MSLGRPTNSTPGIPNTKLHKGLSVVSEGGTDELMSLPHGSFLRIPLGDRIHLNLSQQKPVYFPFFFSIFVTAHCSQQCPSCTLPRVQGTTALTASFFAGL